MGQKTRYNDGWFDKAFMALFARKQLAAAGLSGNCPTLPPSRGREKREGEVRRDGDTEGEFLNTINVKSASL